MIVGWSMADHMESRLVVDALEMAITRRRPDAKLIAHSDRGSQYASDHYQRVPAAAEIVCSMFEVGQCWDNAPVESFFGRLKCELAPDQVFATRDQARAALFEYLEVFTTASAGTRRWGSSPRPSSSGRTNCPIVNFVSTFRREDH
jgi:putative transposase